MKRTQLYLDEDLWSILHLRARQAKVSMGELVRDAVREKYLGDAEERKRNLLKVVGLWKDRTDLPETEEWLRETRKDTRSDRLKLR